MGRIFSFNGRIKRGEYAITFVGYWAIYIMIRALQSLGGDYRMFGFLIVPCIYIFWAQGAKKCHDISKSGWWQIIPFYFFVLISRKSDLWANEYDLAGERYYGADDYEKPFLDEDSDAGATNIPGNEETPVNDPAYPNSLLPGEI